MPFKKKIILLIPSILTTPYHCASIYNPPLVYYILFHLINTLIFPVKLTNHNSSTTMAYILTLTNEILLDPHAFISHRESSSSPSSTDDFEAWRRGDSCPFSMIVFLEYHLNVFYIMGNVKKVRIDENIER